MKHNTKRVLLSAAGLMLSAGNALADTAKSTDLMDSAVDSLDPSVQSWARLHVHRPSAVNLI
jgi:hypothetical protein